MALHDLESILMQHGSVHLLDLLLFLVEHALVVVNIILNLCLMQLVLDGHGVLVRTHFVQQVSIL